LALSVGIALVAPAASSAGVVSEIGDGGEPAVAIDEEGTAHVVFVDDPVPSEITYCRIPRGATECALTKLLPHPPNVDLRVRRPHVFAPGNGSVIVLEYRPEFGGKAGVFAHVGDLQGNFAPARLLAQEDGNDPQSTVPPVPEAATLGPGARVSWLGQLGDELGFQSGSFASPATRTVVMAEGGGPAVAAQGSTAAVAYSAGSPLTDDLTVMFRRHGGAGDLNSGSTWPAATAVEPPSGTRWAGAPVLSGGAQGLFLGYLFSCCTESGNSSKREFRVRRYDETSGGFGPHEVLTPEATVDDKPFRVALTQDAGAVHAAWVDNVRSAGAPFNQLRYRRRDAAGWGQTRTIAGPDAAWGGFVDMRIATGADGAGLAVWSGTNGRDGHVYATDLSIYPCARDDPRPECRPARCGDQACPQARARVANRFIALRLRPDNGRCSVTDVEARLRTSPVGVRQSRPSVVKIQRVRFSVEDGQSAADADAPFERTLSLAGRPPNSRHRVHARVKLKVTEGGKTRRERRRLSTVARVCA
jgi:hypothetical protein